MEQLTQTNGRIVVLLRDSETLTLPRAEKITQGLTMFRKRRATGLVDVVDCDTDTRWMFEFCGGEITQQIAVVGIDVPPEIRALEHPLAMFTKDGVIDLDVTSRH